MIWAVVVSMMGLQTGADIRAAADMAWTRIEADYFDSRTGLYREYFSEKESLRDPAFNWTVGIVITALNGLAVDSEKRKEQLSAYLDKVESYWNDRGPVAGYDVIPNPPGVDRYYDDNAWMVLALLEAYQLTGDARWKARAEGALKYVLSGEDEKLGGGIYWRESDKASKNTCSNSPSAVACFAMFQATGKEEYRAAGYRALDWVMEHLYDPSDKLMWDNMGLSGNIDRTKWSYNAGLTIRALRYAEKDGVTRYPVSAKEMFEAAWAKWHVGEGKLSGPGKFSHLLFEAGIEGGYLSDEQIRSVARSVIALGEGGRWGGSLDRKVSSRNRWELIDEASAVRLLVLAAQALVKE